jgi:hypothetical protein
MDPRYAKRSARCKSRSLTPVVPETKAAAVQMTRRPDQNVSAELFAGRWTEIWCTAFPSCTPLTMGPSELLPSCLPGNYLSPFFDVIWRVRLLSSNFSSASGVATARNPRSKQQMRVLPSPCHPCSSRHRGCALQGCTNLSGSREADRGMVLAWLYSFPERTKPTLLATGLAINLS